MSDPSPPCPPVESDSSEPRHYFSPQSCLTDVVNCSRVRFRYYNPVTGTTQVSETSGGVESQERGTVWGAGARPAPPELPPSFILLRENMERLAIGSPTHRRQAVAPPSPTAPSIRALGLRPLPTMAQPQSSSEQPAAEAAPISRVLIVIAMQTEAMPLIQKFNLVKAPAHESTFPKGAPWTRYHGNYKGLHTDLVWPGKDAVFVDSVGTVSAALVTSASIHTLKPDLIINAGTAGGFKAKGASIGDVFLASEVAFHDRRIPIPVFDMYGIGARKTFAAPNIVKELNFKVGKLSTGDSLDMTPEDEEMILSNEATIKDMEGAAVAYVADMFSTPVLFVKAVTDIVDGEKPTAEEFLQNLAAVTAALDQAVTKVVDFISGKRITDL